MNRKGEVSGFVWIVMAAVGVLIGLALLTAVSPNIGQMTKLAVGTGANTTFTMAAVGSSTELTNCGQKAVVYSVSNVTDGTDVPTNNYSIIQKAGTDGYIAAQIKNLGSPYATVNISCDSYEPKGYVESAGGRSMIGLVVIFMVLLIVIAASPNLRDWIQGKFS